MATKLNTMRVLEQHNIPYEAISYPNTIRDAEEVAEVIGLPPYMVYKTLVVLPVGENKPLLAMLPADRRLDLKTLAKVAGHKKVQMAPHRDAERLTGLQVGGISPLALLAKHWPVYLDCLATDLEHICISAGQRGTQLRVPVMPLAQLLHAKIIGISSEITD